VYGRVRFSRIDLFKLGHIHELNLEGDGHLVLAPYRPPQPMLDLAPTVISLDSWRSFHRLCEAGLPSVPSIQLEQHKKGVSQHSQLIHFRLYLRRDAHMYVWMREISHWINLPAVCNHVYRILTTAGLEGVALRSLEKDTGV
jgi:hypothetical protein